MIRIDVKRKTAFGKEFFYPMELSQDAWTILCLMKRSSFTKEQLLICKQAGWEVNVITPEYKIEDI